jgi:hypothetical protein
MAVCQTIIPQGGAPRAWHGIEIAIKAFQEPEQFRASVEIILQETIGNSYSKTNEDSHLPQTLLEQIEFTPENTAKIFDIMKKNLKINPDYPDDDFTPLEEIGFDVQKLKFYYIIYLF